MSSAKQHDIITHGIDARSPTEVKSYKRLSSILAPHLVHLQTSCLASETS